MFQKHSIAVAGAAISLFAVPAFAQSTSPRPGGSAAPATQAAPASRDDWQKAPEIFAALKAGPGSRIADLGAGQGWLTLRLSRQVGPAGRVFAADISEGALKNLVARVAADSTLRNVELVLSEENDPRLPYGTLDGVVIVNAYHEMTERVAVLEGIKRSLRPGGLLVIVDNTPDDSLTTRTRQVAQHKLAIDLAVDDLQAHGFEVVSQAPQFTEYWMTDHAMRQWMLVARKREGK